MTSLMTWLVPAAGQERDEVVGTVGTLAAAHGAVVFSDCPLRRHRAVGRARARSARSGSRECRSRIDAA